MRVVYWWLLALLISVTPTGVAGEKILHIYTWLDYISPEVVILFELEHDCRVVIDYFDSNEEMLAAVEAGGGYDIVTASAYIADVMNGEGLLAPLDHALIPNLKYLDDAYAAFTDDPKYAYSVPYTLSVAGIGYNKRLVPPGKAGGWDIFAETSLAGRMTIMDDMREALGAALLHLGHSYNSTDEKELNEAAAVLRGWKKNLARFEIHDAQQGLESGEFAVIHNYNGDIGLVMQQNPDIDFYIPREGSSFVIDDFVIAADTPYRELAHAFINHMLYPAIAATNMEDIHFYMPNPQALSMVDPAMTASRAFTIRLEDLKDSEVIRDLGEHEEKYRRLWEEIAPH